MCALQTHSYFEMQCMVYASHDSSLPGAMFEVNGNLALRQKWPLGNHGVDSRYNVCMLLAKVVDIVDDLTRQTLSRWHICDKDP